MSDGYEAEAGPTLPYMNHEAYMAVDMLNKARDRAMKLIQDLAKVHECLADTAQTVEYRDAGLTQADTQFIVKDLNEALTSASNAYLEILEANKRGEALMKKAFMISHPSIPRGNYDGIERGCSC